MEKPEEEMHDERSGQKVLPDVPGDTHGADEPLPPLRIKHLLLSAPGITKEFIYYLEAQHHIHPTRYYPKGGNGKLRRRAYTYEDADIVKQMWEFREEGITPDRAKKRIQRQSSIVTEKSSSYPTGKIIAFMLIRNADKTDDILEHLKIHDGIREAAVVVGDWDVITKIVVDSMMDLDALVIDGVKNSRVIGRGITETRIVISPDNEELNWNDASKVHGHYKTFAYTFIHGRFEGRAPLVKTLRGIDNACEDVCICEAACLYGSADTILKIAGRGLLEINSFVRNKIKTIPRVERVETFPIVLEAKKYQES